MPADVMQELLEANEANTNGTQDVVGNAIANIQSMPDCENLVKNVLKATTGFESLGEAAQQSGKSTSDILDRVAFVFEKITARANEAQASVYGFGSSFDKVKPDAFSSVEKRIKEIKNQFDLTSSSIDLFSSKYADIGRTATTVSTGNGVGTQKESSSGTLTSQERAKLKSIAKFLDMSASTMFQKTLSLRKSSSTSSTGANQYAKTGVQYSKQNESLATRGGVVRGVDKNQDTQLAALQPGELVVPKNKVQQFKKWQNENGYKLGGEIGRKIESAAGNIGNNAIGAQQQLYAKKLRRLYQIQQDFDDIDLDNELATSIDIDESFPSEDDAKRRIKKVDDAIKKLNREQSNSKLNDIRNETIGGAPIPSVKISSQSANNISQGLAQRANSVQSSETKKDFAYVGKQIKGNQDSARATGAILKIAQKTLGESRVSSLDDLTGLNEEEIEKLADALKEGRDIIEDAKEQTASWSDALENLNDESKDFIRDEIRGMGEIGKLLKGNLVGTMALVGAVLVLGKAIKEASDKLAQFFTEQAKINKEFAQLKGVAKGLFDGADIKGFKDEMNLTREQASQLTDSFREAALSGSASFAHLETMAANIKDQFGTLDISLLKEAVNLIKDLPEKQIDVLINGKGTLDDEANLIANLMEGGKLDVAAELITKGAFGEIEGMTPQMSEADRRSLETQAKIAEATDNIYNLLNGVASGALSEYSQLLGAVVSGVAPLATATISTIIGAKALVGLSRKTGPNYVNVRDVNASVPGGGGQAGGKLAGTTANVIGGIVTTAVVAAAAYFGNKLIESASKSREEEKERMNASIQDNTKKYGIAMNTEEYGYGTGAVKENSGKGMIVGAAAGAIAGGLLAGKIGAAIGTAIAPGVGTAIGAVSGAAVGAYQKMKDYFKYSATQRKNLDEKRGVAAKLDKIKEAQDKERAFLENRDSFTHEQMLKGIVELSRISKITKRIADGQQTARHQANVKAAQGNMNMIGMMGGNSSNFMLNQNMAVSELKTSFKQDYGDMQQQISAILNNKNLTAAGKEQAIADVQANQLPKVFERFIHGLQDSIAQFDKIPEIVVGGIQSKMSAMSLERSTKNMFGTSATAQLQASTGFNSAMESASATMESVANDIKNIESAMAMLDEQLKKTSEELAKAEDEVIALGGATFGISKSNGNSNRMKQNGDAYNKIIEEYESKQIEILRKSGNNEAAQLNMDVQQNSKANAKVRGNVQNAIANNESWSSEKTKREAKALEPILESHKQSLEGILSSKTSTDEERAVAKKELERLDAIKKNIEGAGNAKDLRDAIDTLETSIANTSGALQEGNNKRLSDNPDMQKLNDEMGKLYTAAVKARTAQMAASGATDARVEKEKAYEQELTKLTSTLDEVSSSAERLARAMIESADVIFNRYMKEKSQQSARFNATSMGGAKAMGLASGFEMAEITALSNNIPKAKEEISSKKDEWNKQWDNLRGQVASQSPETAALFEKLGEANNARMEAMLDPTNEKKAARAAQLEKEATEYQKQHKDAIEDFAKKNKQVFDTLMASANGFGDAIKVIVDSEAELKEKIASFFDNMKRDVQRAIEIDYKYRKSDAKYNLADSRYEIAQGSSNYANMKKEGDRLVSNASERSSSRMSAAQEAWDIKLKQLEELRRKGKDNGGINEEVYQKERAVALINKEEDLNRVRLQGQKEIFDAIQKQADGMRAKADRASEALDIQLDVAETIGMPFEYILEIQKDQVRLAQQKAMIEEQALAKSQELLEKGEITQEQYEQQKLKTSKAQADVLKASFGAQRDSLDKMLGKIMGTFNEVGGIFGPDGAYAQVRKMGQGYVTNAQTGLNWAAGDTSASGYADRAAGNANAIYGTQLPWGGKKAQGGSTTQVKEIGYGKITNGTQSQGDVDTFVTPSNRVINANNYEWVINADDFERFANAYGLTEDQLFAKMRSGNVPRKYAWGGPTEMSLSDALHKDKNFFKENYSDKKQKTDEELVEEKIAAYKRLGAYNLNPNTQDNDVFDEKGKLKDAKQKAEQVKNRYGAVVGKNQGKRNDGISAKNDTAGEASSQLTDAMTRKVSRTGELDNTGDPKKTPDGKATQSDKILLEILKDTHKIVELMGGEVDWDVVKKLEENANKKENAKSEGSGGSELAKNPERNAFIAKEIDPSLSGKSTAEMEAELNKLVEEAKPNGERSESSLKRQRNLQSAILYDKLFGKKNGSGQVEKSKGVQEQTLDVQQEILKYVKLIYELLKNGAGAGEGTKNQENQEKQPETVEKSGSIKDSIVSALPKLVTASIIGSKLIPKIIKNAPKIKPLFSSVKNGVSNFFRAKSGLAKFAPSGKIFKYGNIFNKRTLNRAALKLFGRKVVTFAKHPIRESKRFVNGLLFAKKAKDKSNIFKYGFNTRALKRAGLKYFGKNAVAKISNGIKAGKNFLTAARENYQLGRIGELYGKGEKGVSRSSRFFNKLGGMVNKGRGFLSSVRENYQLGKAGLTYGNGEKGVSFLSRASNKLGSVVNSGKNFFNGIRENYQLGKSGLIYGKGEKGVSFSSRLSNRFGSGVNKIKGVFSAIRDNYLMGKNGLVYEKGEKGVSRLARWTNKAGEFASKTKGRTSELLTKGKGFFNGLKNKAALSIYNAKNKFNYGMLGGKEKGAANAIGRGINRVVNFGKDVRDVFNVGRQGGYTTKGASLFNRALVGAGRFTTKAGEWFNRTKGVANQKFTTAVNKGKGLLNKGAISLYNAKNKFNYGMLGGKSSGFANWAGRGINRIVNFGKDAKEVFQYGMKGAHGTAGKTSLFNRALLATGRGVSKAINFGKKALGFGKNIASGTKSVFARGLARAPKRAMLKLLGIGKAQKLLGIGRKAAGYGAKMLGMGKKALGFGKNGAIFRRGIGRGVNRLGIKMFGKGGWSKGFKLLDVGLAAYGAYKGWNEAATKEGVDNQIAKNKQNYGINNFSAAGDAFKNGQYAKAAWEATKGIGRAAWSTMDFVEHGRNIGAAARLIGDTVSESYGQADKMKGLTQKSSELNARQAQKMGIDSVDYDNEVNRLLNSEEGRKKRAELEAQQKNDTGWRGNFMGNLLTFGGHNRAGKANVDDTMRAWAESQAKRNLGKNHRASHPVSNTVQTASKPSASNANQGANVNLTSPALASPNSSSASQESTSTQQASTSESDAKKEGAQQSPTSQGVDAGTFAASPKTNKAREQKEFDSTANMKTLVRKLDTDATNGVVESQAARAPEGVQGNNANGNASGGSSTIEGNITIEINVKLDNDMLNGTVAEIVENNIQKWVQVALNNPGGG